MNKDRPSRILVADDDPISLQFFVTALHEFGIEATAAANGNAVLDACRHASFDLLLLDRRMPGMGGAELLRELRRRGCTAVAIATSAELDAATRAELESAGYADAVTKPIGVDRLRTVLAAHLLRSDASHRSSNHAPHANRTAAPTLSGVLEDGPALAGVGGDGQTLRALRDLFAKELSAAPPAIASMPPGELGEWLHRLRASCRYCGAMRLGEEAEKLECRLKTGKSFGQDELNAFLETCVLTLEALSKREP